MSVKTATAKAGNGLLSAMNAIVTAANDGPRKERIEAIDTTIAMLQEERARLVDELIEKDDL